MNEFRQARSAPKYPYNSSWKIFNHIISYRQGGKKFNLLEPVWMYVLFSLLKQIFAGVHFLFTCNVYTYLFNCLVSSASECILRYLWEWDNFQEIWFKWQTIWTSFSIIMIKISHHQLEYLSVCSRKKMIESSLDIDSIPYSSYPICNHLDTTIAYRTSNHTYLIFTHRNASFLKNIQI